VRYSIIVLFLLINFGLHAFQPLKEIQISEREFATEAQNKQSYLSLLPVDITRVVNQYTHPNIANEIARIRKRYLTDSNPENMLKFLNDKDFNQKIIDDLSEKYLKEADSKKLMTAIMLNSPISFKIASNIVKREHGHALNDLRFFYRVYKEYMNLATMDCEDALNYTDFFVTNFKEYRNSLLQYFQSLSLDPVYLKNYEALIERLAQEQLDDINTTLQSKLKELSKEAGWTCAIQ
jgi:hypothetical protein